MSKKEIVPQIQIVATCTIGIKGSFSIDTIEAVALDGYESDGKLTPLEIVMEDIEQVGCDEWMDWAAPDLPKRLGKYTLMTKGGYDIDGLQYIDMQWIAAASPPDQSNR